MLLDMLLLHFEKMEIEKATWPECWYRTNISVLRLSQRRSHNATNYLPNVCVNYRCTNNNITFQNKTDAYPVM